MAETTTQNKYVEEVAGFIGKFLEGKNVRCFIFGSSLQKSRFGDVDVAISGDISDIEILKLKEKLQESAIPYKVDVVNLDKTSKSFKNNVLNGDILWIKR